MNPIELIDKYYTKENSIKMLTSYVLYYQISLGSYAFETTLDQQETINKLKELNLTLNPNTMMLCIFSTLLTNSTNSNLDKEFDNILKTSAIIHALEDFVENDKDLLNKNIFLENKKNEILENNFFNSQMKMQYLSEYPSMNKYYKNIINEEYILNVKEIIIKNFLK